MMRMVYKCSDADYNAMNTVCVNVRVCVYVCAHLASLDSCVVVKCSVGGECASNGGSSNLYK